ncbi:MAG: aminotransferase class I/II-fold pyridoxal phosphate-dependent enzyme [Bacteroidetes bacterium]|nr:aminotransferase class I/II-fold pyridoxal phosphate-dependent enzyme [Bacteroidota bacterium]
MKQNKWSKGFASLCVEHINLEKKILPHAEAIYATSAFTFESPQHAMELFNDRDKGYIYSRWSNPTVEMAEQKLALLETYKTDISARAQLFSSGMAAISAVILSVVKEGEKMLTQHQLYGTTDELMQSLLPEFGIETINADLHNLKAVESLLQSDKKIKLIYIESPSNPLMEVFDISALCNMALTYKVKVAVDNTFSTSYLQQPLKLGADFSVYSTTKFLNGHGNNLGGVVIGKDKKFIKEKVWRYVKLLGSNSNAFDAWLLLQGLKTLSLRMDRHCVNAKLVAEFLQQHRAIAHINYTGFKTHPQYNIIKKQMRLPGSMLSFELKGGLSAGKKLMKKVKVCKLVTSLGTTDTLIQHPASMTHVNVSVERRIAMGLTDGFVRMSVGIEDAEDIINDLKYALE